MKYTREKGAHQEKLKALTLVSVGTLVSNVSIGTVGTPVFGWETTL